jgi:DNA repair protein SbcC/Rad50
MIPVKISLEGFMTYRDKQTLSFDGSSLCILAGPNGAGKSSVFDAITLALYNCHRAGKKNARALINHGADRLIVEFDFQIGDELYRVRRTVPRKGAATRQAFYLRSGESNSSVLPVPDTQYEDGFEQWIESTIGLKYETFISSVLLLQGQSTKLLDAVPKERHQMLEEFVNLAAYKRLYELADGQRKQLAEKLKDLGKQLQISNLLSEDDLTQSEAALQVANDRWEVAQQAMDQLTAVLEQSKHWNIRREEIDQHEKKLQQLQQLLEQSAEIREQHDRYQILNFVLPQLRSILDSRGRLDSDTRKITQMTEEVRELKAELEKSTESHKAQREEKTQLEKQFRKLTQEQTAIAHQIRANAYVSLQFAGRLG